ncbi:MAG: exo-alpha-sialidase [Opitutaceae bacterium]|nr:exo-alpha-sialidase [Opitutaceae bacterium]
MAPADAEHSRRGEATMVALRDGRVLLAYGRFTGRSDPGYARLAAARADRYAGSYIERDNDFGEVCAITLDRDGQPDSCERTLVPCPPDGLNAMNPALARLPDGRLGLLYSHRLSRHVSSRRCLTSGDEGATWSVPVVVYNEGYVSGGHDRFHVLSTGRLLAPLHCTDDWEKHFLHTRVARSDDAGRTWQVSAPIVVPQVIVPSRPGAESGCNEGGVAERADGSLLMSLRTAMGTQFCTESRDRGETWGSPRSLEVSSPSAPAHLSRLPGSDDLLLIWNPHYDANEPMGGHRRTLVACVSTDGGRSWPVARRKILVSDPARNSDYPAVLHCGGEAWIAFRQSDHPTVIQGRMSTRLMRVPHAWLRG